MTMGSHLKNSEGSYGDAKAIDIRKMIDEEYRRELIEIKAQLNVLTEFLQQNEENQRCEWNLRKRVKWFVEILWAKKQRQKMRHGLKEKLRATECEEEIHKGEPEQREIHGEDSNVGGDLMFETSNGVEKPYLFPDGLFMVVGVIDDEQPFEAIMKKEENIGEQSFNFVLSREEEQYLNGTLIRNDEPNEETNFSLHTNFLHVGVTEVVISFQTDANRIETEGEKLAKVVVNEDATK